jgi:hypothetical protein
VECRHIERRSRKNAPASDGAATNLNPRFVIKWGQADQRSDLPTVDGSELGHFAEQLHCADRSNATNAREQGKPLREIG